MRTATNLDSKAEFAWSGVIWVVLARFPEHFQHFLRLLGIIVLLGVFYLDEPRSTSGRLEFVHRHFMQYWGLLQSRPQPQHSHCPPTVSVLAGGN